MSHSFYVNEKTIVGEKLQKKISFSKKKKFSHFSALFVILSINHVPPSQVLSSFKYYALYIIPICIED